MSAVCGERSRLIAVTGGIGSGKSVVCRLLRLMGYAVFDSDIEARRLMDGSQEVHRRLLAEFGEGVFTPDGRVDRKALAARVFGDGDELRRLNAIVHPAVASALRRWRERQSGALCFVETAILAESGLDREVDLAWHVTAPERVRAGRVVARSGLTPVQARRRIASQRNDPADYNCPHQTIDNGGAAAVIPRVVRLLEQALGSYSSPGPS